MTKRLGYIRLSREDSNSLSIENQKADLLAYDPNMKLYIDSGVSGEINMTREGGAWQELWKEFEQDPKGTEVCLYSLDRMGRKKGKVSSYTEDILDRGGKIIAVRDKKVYADPDDFSQDLELYFAGFSNEQYRKEIQKKTRRAIKTLKDADVKLGREPKLTEADMAVIQNLHSKGLGYSSISKIVEVTDKAGKVSHPSVPTIKRVLNGEYLSREAWHRHNADARRRLALGVK